MTSEASICMKTNKKMTSCPQEKTTFLHNCMRLVWHFIQKQAYFAGTVGSFITIRALGNEPLASKCRNLRPPAPPGDTDGPEYATRTRRLSSGILLIRFADSRTTPTFTASLMPPSSDLVGSLSLRREANAYTERGNSVFHGEKTGRRSVSES